MPDEKNFTSLQVSTDRRMQTIDITGEVADAVRSSGISGGICHVFVPHTTAAVTINENADPDVQDDLLMGLEAIVPSRLGYAHSEGNSPAHIMASMIGSSESIFVENGKLLLGTWQGIYFCEFDGPRTRKAWVKVRGD